MLLPPEKKYTSEIERKIMEFPELPPGIRFKPTDEELIVFYLKPKVDEQPVPPSEINTVDFYKNDPQTLADDFFPEDDVYYGQYQDEGFQPQQQQDGFFQPQQQQDEGFQPQPRQQDEGFQPQPRQQDEGFQPQPRQQDEGFQQQPRQQDEGFQPQPRQQDEDEGFQPRQQQDGLFCFFQPQQDEESEYIASLLQNFV
ncbi:PREDICTED: mediator of RNA polymerase II transcription subunit 15-like isoform X2 [Erythranthe guttata]|uniref:mediator of RNA polymerase II transcription subunit 15-like isoform X2 n=1 Tax=Erythranthe guttata TaxID=4155 RepID=UPI00064D87CD|nr:PREDICTED: mediator of RNA polymerase II transcription subunit 15-like isoform X2 [Erythranthe guttata]|eukprot:XP_012844652.1 PREDICTED: mediator of RNA polymerase II transcription subunit 15-like isoform X2 [Erythranthe guttata]